MELKQKAIEKIKSCERREDFSTNNLCGFYYDQEKEHKKPKACFCEVCQEFMKFFNIREDELI